MHHDAWCLTHVPSRRSCRTPLPASVSEQQGARLTVIQQRERDVLQARRVQDCTNRDLEKSGVHAMHIDIERKRRTLRDLAVWTPTKAVVSSYECGGNMQG
ncbi:hypothetical protein L210DRAFT_686710 [Boletus edulis BED1]|uniref:Uncharacterized protein n=1 Tax=Boletus edulis BED1 TaxID=1328754 RepID=A0AAD4BDG2_BOLED|nr:hypothetical protein L210DRAFT_686710 [Boletus edulis BED1]